MAKIFYAPTGELYQYKYYFEEDFFVKQQQYKPKR